MALLTDRTLAVSSAITASTLIHIVDVNDISQNPAGSSYKAELGQVFNSLSGFCISDLYVTNVHGCSPINIQPNSSDDVYMVLGGGNVGINTTSPTEKLHVSGDTIINGQNLFLSDFFSSIPVLPNYKGITTIFDYNKTVGVTAWNLNTTGLTAHVVLNDSNDRAIFALGGSNYTRSGTFLPSSTGSNFYRRKLIIKGDDTNDGIVINPVAENLSSKIWFEFAGYASTVLAGDGNTPSVGQLGLGLNTDGTETPTCTLQVGGTGTTGTFKYVDGNQSNGYILSSDNDGNASWVTISSLSGSSILSVTDVSSTYYTATTSYSYYGVTLDAEVNIEIPDATGLDGFTFRIKDERGNASIYPIIVTPALGLIDGSSSVTMSINYMSLTMVARNNNWWII